MAISYSLARMFLQFGLTGQNSSSGSASWSGNPNIYLGLSTTLPNRDGTGITEPTSNGYARVLIGKSGELTSWKLTKATESQDGSVYNKDTIYFPEVTGVSGQHPWGILTHAVIFTAATGGTMLAFSELTNAIEPAVGTIPIIRTYTEPDAQHPVVPTGDLIISLD